MADSETETNPRKKIKIEHHPDQNGDFSEESKVEAASSQDNQDKEEEDIEGGQTCTAEEEAKRTEEVQKESEDNLGKIGNNESDKKLNIKDNGDDDIDMDVGAGGRDIDVSDAESDVSAISDASSLSGEDSWKASAAGPMAWVMRCMEDGVDPRSILAQVIPDEKNIPDVDDFTLWKLVVNLVSEPPPRNKLPDINTLEDVLQLMQKCQKIMVLTGAGVSVSCGIPDFRSRNGIYARLAVDFPDLPDPQAMFDIRYFRGDQRPFFKFAKEIYPGQFEPSKSHKFIKLIEDHGKLLRNYTQNIDTLEQVAGIKNVIQCHGSFATATCMTCHHKCSSDDIKQQIMEQVIPLCPECDPQTPLSVMKPDIVFFGESLPEEFHQQMTVDKDDCDLLIVIGSSLKVRPVALIPNSLPAHVPQILINKEHLRNLNFDVELLGDCDLVVSELCRRLGGDWTKIAREETMTQIGMDELITPPSSPNRQENYSNESEKKLQEKDCKVNEKQTEISETSGKMSTAVGEVTSNIEKESDAKCQCDKVSELDKEVSNDTHVSKSTEKSEKEAEGNDGTPSESVGKNASETETDSTVTVNDNIEKTSGQEKSTGNESMKETENGKVSDDNKPGSSTDDNVKPGSSTDLQELRKMWRPGRENIALRLGKNQFCYIPPRKYIFPEAEYYTVVRSNSESDMTSDMDRDTTMDSSREFNLNHTNTDSSAIEGELIDLTTDDDEDEKLEPKPESVEKGPDDDIGTDNDNKGTKTDDIEDKSQGAGDNEKPVKNVEATTAEILID